MEDSIFANYLKVSDEILEHENQIQENEKAIDDLFSKTSGKSIPEDVAVAIYAIRRAIRMRQEEKDRAEELIKAIRGTIEDFMKEDLKHVKVNVKKAQSNQNEGRDVSFELDGKKLRVKYHGTKEEI